MIAKLYTRQAEALAEAAEEYDSSAEGDAADLQDVLDSTASLVQRVVHHTTSLTDKAVRGELSRSPRETAEVIACALMATWRAVRVVRQVVEKERDIALTEFDEATAELRQATARFKKEWPPSPPPDDWPAPVFDPARTDEADRQAKAGQGIPQSQVWANVRKRFKRD